MRPGQRAFLFGTLILACASAASAQTMRYRFKEGDQLSYVLEHKNRTLLQLAGADIDMKVDLNLSMFWHVLKVDPQGNAQVRVKVTRSKMTMDSLVGMIEVDSNDKNGPSDLAGKMLAQMNKAIAAMEITGTMLPTGEMKDVKVSDETVKAMKTIPGADKLGDLSSPDNFKDMISGIVFPTGPVAKGKTWTNKVETNTPSGKITSENVYSLEGTVEKDGATLEKIANNPTIKIVPDPKAQMKIKTIQGTGHTLFDNKTGRMVESVSNNTKTGTVSVMGLTLDQTTTETTTIRLQKLSAETKGDAGAKFVSVRIDEDNVIEKVIATEPLETLAGAARSFTVERGFERSVSLAGKGEASAELKALVEAKLGEKLGNRVSIKESISLDGKELTKVNVQWVERSRRGIATRSDGTTVEFLVKVGLRIKLEKAK